ncbi:hypothetical protein KEH57_22215 [Burkholderia cenocepacia]|uniref:hypothetical protein n=1 Tax=Burkholderia cenocepacia TaxID=95486 RepID=UPI001BA83878|nr:hypothetical protein [Burkholderia cenocepacia]QUO29229.1 hypothetical protein KEH57_22215 [Burkholderia cenocepacia]
MTILIEEMSRRRVPGLIMIGTDARTIQDTDIQRAAIQLVRDETIDAFRSVDLRENNLQVVISAPARWWISSIVNAEDREALSSCGWSSVVEDAADAFAKNLGGSENGLIDFYPVYQAICSLAHAAYCPSALSDEQISFLEQDVGKPPPTISFETRDQIFDIVDRLYRRHFRSGWSMSLETKHRPLIALFSRSDLANVALAGAVHSLFYWL